MPFPQGSGANVLANTIFFNRTYNAFWFGGSKEQKIQAAILAAKVDGMSYVFIPGSMLPYDATKVTFDRSVRMIREGGNWDVFDIQAYGAAGDGLADDTQAIIAAYEQSAGQGKCYFPGGEYMVTDTIPVTLNNVHIDADGTTVSTILFNPTADKECFLINKGISSMTEEHPYQGVFDNTLILSNFSLRNLSIVGHPSAVSYKKTLIKSIDTSVAIFENIFLRCDNDTGDSIGFELRGREFTTLMNTVVNCPQPMIIGVNPNYATLCADHLHVRDWYSVTLKPSGGVHIYIEDMAVLSNVTFDGQQSYAGGESAIYWPDTRMNPATGTSQVGAYAYASNNIIFMNPRFEQATGGGWFLYATPNAQSISLVNAYAASGANNVYLWNCFVAQIGPMIFPIAGGVALNLKYCHAVTGTGCYFQDTSTIDLNGGNMVVSMESARTSTVRPIGENFLIQAAGHAQELSLNLPAITTPTFLGGVHFGDSTSTIFPDGIGAATTFTTLSASTSDGHNYLLDDATKRRWQVGSITVFDSGVPILPGGADPFTINTTIGALSFTNFGARTITISGNYFPALGWGAQNLQHTYNTLYVNDDGTVDAFLRFRSPGFFGTGVTSQFGIATTQSTAVIVDGAKQFVRGHYLRTAGANRGSIVLSSIDETGGSLGSSMQLIVYDDSAATHVALDIARLDGSVKFQKVGFNGVAASGKVPLNVAAVDPATTMALVNQLRGLAITFGQGV